MKRRSFLQLFSVAPLSAPLAAKAAVDETIGKLTGVALAGASSLGAISMPPVQGGGNWEKTLITAAQYAKTVGLPEWLTDQIRGESKHVYILDPDIAAKRSWSMAVKIMTQQERNYRRRMEGIAISGTRAKGRMAFRAVTGWDWPF